MPEPPPELAPPSADGPPPLRLPTPPGAVGRRAPDRPGRGELVRAPRAGQGREAEVRRRCRSDPRPGRANGLRLSGAGHANGCTKLRRHGRPSKSQTLTPGVRYSRGLPRPPVPPERPAPPSPPSLATPPGRAPRRGLRGMPRRCRGWVARPRSPRPNTGTARGRSAAEGRCSVRATTDGAGAG